MSRRYYEDEIPTRPSGGIHTDPDTMLGRCLVEIVNLRKRVEALESLAFSKETASDRPSAREYLPLVKKTITAAVLGIAGILSALRELGYLK